LPAGRQYRTQAKQRATALTPRIPNAVGNFFFGVVGGKIRDFAGCGDPVVTRPEIRLKTRIITQAINPDIST
jgi:hypothetical protein